MLSFASKPRGLRLRAGSTLKLPTKIWLTATLGPSWLFGAGGDDPKFVVSGSTGVSIFFNANNGRWHVQGGSQPAPTQVDLQAPGGVFALRGNVATYTLSAKTPHDITNAADAMVYGLPMMLNAHLPFPCVVEHVVGKSSGGAFGYEVDELQFALPLVSEDSLNHNSLQATRFLFQIDKPDQRRIYAGLAYFNQATRLLEVGQTRWEFMAEAVLNLAKTLEVLFPPSGGSNTRDAVRSGLGQCSVGSDEAETWFLPALALRSNLDVAHVKLAFLERDHIETLTQYAEGAVAHFRRLLQTVLAAAAKDQPVVPPYAADAVDGAALATLQKLAERLIREARRHNV